MTAQEVCKEIRDKLGEESAGGNDHGLFFPDQGKWLDPGRTLDYYDLKTGVSCSLELKTKKERNTKEAPMGLKPLLCVDLEY